MSEPITFSNPRLHAEFPDWPLGGNKRGPCRFWIEHGKRGAVRQTTGKPKCDTYSGPTCIVDGSDGRTYLLQVAHPYGFVRVSRSDFMDAGADVGGHAFENQNPERYQTLLRIILDSGASLMPVS